MLRRPFFSGPRKWLMVVASFLVFAVGSIAATPGDGPIAPAHDKPATPPANVTFNRGVSIGNWMAKIRRGQPFGGTTIGPDDLAWIAQQGFDHVRIPVDGRLLVMPDGSLDETKITRFLEAVKWARDNHLGVVLDMHFLPGGTAAYDANNQDPAIFTDARARATAAEFWGRLAKRLAGEGAWLRFELVNEPMAPGNDQLNTLNKALLTAIRAADTNRVVYVTSNLESAFTTLEDVVVPDDPHVAIVLHYDEPLIFSHQRASWKQLPPDMPPVNFPGTVPDLSKILPAGHPLARTSLTELKIEDVNAAFAKASAWLEKHAPGKEVYLGEFGCYETAPADSRRTYIATVRGAAEAQGWGWAVWDYNSSFAVRGNDGQPTVVWEGLFKH
jgi:endoglucanase